MRNSSLAERSCAEDTRGSSTEPKPRHHSNVMGRGAYRHRRSMTGRTCGEGGSENAGMSSEKDGENPSHRKPKVSRATIVGPG